MAAINAGCRYGLRSSVDFVNKELIFMKLTDSSSRAIEDYLNNKDKSTQTPTIQFLGNDGGNLSFPTCMGEAVRFNFNISSNQDIEGPQGSFECVQQTSSRCLESLGAVHRKMRVLAKDDVYEATRHRMAVAEQQHKRSCTREIKLDKACDRKFKRTKPSLSIPPRSGLLPSLQGPVPPSHTRPQGNNHTQKPGNPEIMKRSIRDRLIHLLAVRPYKKPEIYAVLNREGVREREKSLVMSILSSIATIRDNTYHIIRHVWNDVQEDWPFFTEQDRQMLKRRKPQNLTPPGSSDGGSSASSGRSPSSVHPGSPPSTIEAPPLHKRPGYVNGVDGLPTKRQRIAHNRKPEEVLKKSDCPTIVKPLPTSRLYSPLPRHEEPTTRQPSARLDAPLSKVPIYPENDTVLSPLVVTPSPVKTNHQIQKSYTRITNLVQRRRYKDDFNSFYAEYRKIYDIVIKESDKFAELEQKLLEHPKDSEGWKNVKNLILKEYQNSKKDNARYEARKRFQYLHEKLSHIKKLVLDYDAAHST